MEPPQSPATECAPAERATSETIERQSAAVRSFLPGDKLLNAFPVMALVLNAERQIVLCNAAFADFLGADDRSQLIGLRSGEALSCIHAYESESGCGTTGSCGVCGALKAILAAQIGHADSQVCRLTRRTPQGDEALDLQVWTTPIDAGSERFTVFSAIDISDTIRRRALERVFFGEAMKIAKGIEDLAQSFGAAVSPDERNQIAKMVSAASARLVSVIGTQRDLASAERGDLAVAPVPISSSTFVRNLAARAESWETGRGRRVLIDDKSQDVSFRSDPLLLQRVADHMMANALEASRLGDAVTLGCRQSDGRVEIWVHNSSAMPKNVQMQIFQRSFSTKGPGRGLGTYMMKMLSERHLKGTVSFTSTPEEGTTFIASYPLELL